MRSVFLHNHCHCRGIDHLAVKPSSMGVGALEDPSRYDDGLGHIDLGISGARGRVFNGFPSVPLGLLGPSGRLRFLPVDTACSIDGRN
jgi:hypothetical protein